MHHSENIVIRLLFILMIILFFLIFTFGIYALIAFLLLNAKKALKKEGRSLPHLLTFIFAILLIIAVIVAKTSGLFPDYVQIFFFFIYGLIFYYSVHLTQYIVATILCNLSRPQKNQDYIIVHGAGLKDGNVTPLLAGRVDKAIDFYNKQKSVSTPPKLLLSGGKGSDEARSEAKAMADYAISKGIPQNDIILEEKSATTLQNMMFSKQIMDTAGNGKPYRCIYVTSNYHLLRTGIYARRAGLKISGIGSKTAFYYLPNALLREYIAYTPPPNP